MLKTSDKTKVLFFEVRGGSMQRFPLWLSNSLRQINEDLSFVFLAEDRIEKEIQIKLTEELDNCEFHQSPLVASVSSLRDKIEKINPTIIVIFAHRLPDMALLIAAKQLGIRTVYYQHGLYIPFMRRTIGLFFSDVFKVFRYVFYGISVGFHSGVGRMHGLISFIKMFIFGHNIHEISLPTDKITADNCLVYGNHWVDYHFNHYGYKKDNIRIIGTPDLDGINLDSSEILDRSILANKFCYVAQTLVEDGRLDRSSFKIFIKNLSKQINNINGELLIKLHPRSDKSLFEDMDCKYKYCNDFPISDIYLGHYSTMLIRGIAYSEKFLLIDFPGHNIPDYISLLASETLKYNDEIALKDALDSLSKKTQNTNNIDLKRKKLKNYFDVSNIKSFDRAAAIILRHIS